MSEESSPSQRRDRSAEQKNVLFRMPSFAQELGGDVLRRLNVVIPWPHIDHSLAPVEALVREQNEYIDMRKDAHLAANLFRSQNDMDPSELHALMQSYRAELDQRHTLSEKYALFMDERYTDYVYTLDLAETKQAASHEEIEKLRSEYVELRDRLIIRGTIDGELERSDRTTRFFFNPMKHPQYAAGVRNRKLFCFERDGRKISVAKRMDFLIDRTHITQNELDARRVEATKQKKVQRLIDNEDETIIPVRTVYFATNQEIRATKE